MANQNALTAAHIRYLLVLLRLTAANGHTRCVDLAAALELSPPSVHNMVDTMTALGLVKKGTRGAVSLTEYGSSTTTARRHCCGRASRSCRSRRR